MIMTVMISSLFLFQREGLSFSNWDKWVVKGTQDYKLKSFLKYFKVRTQLLWIRIQFNPYSTATLGEMDIDR